MDEILASLNDAQRQAVQHIEGPLLTLAGPGSGKTRVVTHRVAYMLRHGIPDRQIVALTFTNKAADEMRARLDRLAPGSRVWMGTFHRFCSRLLRRYGSMVGLHENFSIYDTDDSRKLLKEAIVDSGVELIHETPARVAAAIGWAKNDLITAERFEPSSGSPIGAIVKRVYPHYQKRLLAANAVDFDDLLMHVAVMLRANPELRQTLDERFNYILVDEYQDTNLAQYAIVRALSVDHPNLAVTGDPDQSIYGWRGATIRNILEFERDFPDVCIVRLENNYRSTKAILRVADQLIANNRLRKEKTLFTDNSEGKPVRIVVYQTSRQESDAIAARIANEVSAGRRRPRDCAVFYRTNALSRALERAFKSVGLPYQIVRGLEFYQRKEIKDILAYLHLLNNPADDVAFLRTINTPPRRIGKTTVNRLAAHARRNGLSLLEAARQAGLIESLAKRTAVGVAKFVTMYDKMQLVGGETVEAAIGNVLHHTEYREWLKSGESEEEQQRLENIDELLTDAREFDETHPDDGGLEAFLEQASLVADADDWESETDRVTLMTLHAAKGLEFPVVFIVAVEKDILPHERNADDPDKLEEERRLLFVGITRAEEELHLSAAQQRTFRGKTRYAATSSFLMELPRDEMEIVGQLGYGGATFDDSETGADWESDDGNSTGSAFESDLDDLEIFEDAAVPPTTGRQGTGRQGTGRQGTGRKKRQAAKVNGPFRTAAEMIGQSSRDSSCDPETFQHGMVVTHPEYGLGKILALGGSGDKRSATVQFASLPRPKTFRLTFCPLRPAKGGRNQEDE